MPKLFLGALLALVLAGCGPIEPPTARVLDGQTIEVVTTIGMITDIVEPGRRLPGRRPGLMGRASTRTSTRRARATCAGSRRPTSSSTAACTWRQRWQTCSSGSASAARRQAVTDEIPARACCPPGTVQGALRPARLVRRRALDAGASSQVAETRSSRLDPAHAAEYRAQRGRLPGAAGGARRATCTRSAATVPREQAGADHGPRRLRLLRPAPTGSRCAGCRGSARPRGRAGDVQALAELIVERRDPGGLRRDVASRRGRSRRCASGARRGATTWPIGGAALLRRAGRPGTPAAPTSGWSGTTSTRSSRRFDRDERPAMHAQQTTAIEVTT